MFVFCAHYLGSVADENRQVFDDYVENTNLPMVSKPAPN